MTALVQSHSNRTYTLTECNMSNTITSHLKSLVGTVSLTVVFYPFFANAVLFFFCRLEGIGSAFPTRSLLVAAVIQTPRDPV